MKHNQSITIDIIQLVSNLYESNTPNELSLIYILKGKCTLFYEEQVVTFSKKEFVFVGSNQRVKLLSDDYNKETIILRLTFHLPEIESLINQNWRPNLGHSNIEVYQSLGKDKFNESLFRLTLERLTRASKARSFSDLLLVSDVLDKVEGLLSFHNHDIIHNQKQNIHPFVIDILEFTKENFTTKLSLGQFATDKFVSEAYLSKLFKDEVGITFSDYLSSLRLEAAVEELRHSDEPILSIALNNGFPNPKSFTAVFKKQYGVTPHEYRKENIPKEKLAFLDNKDENFRYLTRQESIQVIAQFMLTQNIKQAKGLSVESMSLDLGQSSIGLLKKPQKVINIGHANNGLKESVRQQVKMLQEKIPFSICRFYGFCSESTSEFDIIKDRFVNNHRLFSFMREMNLKPMFVLMIDEEKGIEELSSRLETLKEMIQGYVQYESSFREGWYLELKSERQVSLAFFKEVYECCNQFLLDNFSTGYLGFNLDFNQTSEWSLFFEEVAVTFTTPPAFISLSYETTIGIKSQSSQFFSEFETQSNHLKLYLNKLGYDPKIYMTEWHLISESLQLSQSTFSRSAILLKALVEMSSYIDGIGFWLNVDSEKSMPATKKLGNQSIYLHGILKRPLFFLLTFFDRIGDEILIHSNHYIVTKKFNSFYVLYYNEHHLDKEDSAYENLWKTTRQRTTFLFDQLPTGNYLIKRFLLDSHHGGIYHQWLKSGGMTELDTDMQEYLQQSVVPEFLTKELEITDGKLEEFIDLEMNACYLMILNRIS